MFIGIGKTLPQIADLPGPSRPGYPSGGGREEFEIEIETTTSSYNFQMQTQTSSAPWNNFDVDWGDGSAVENWTNYRPAHVYTNPGTYIVKITGQFPGPSFNTGVGINGAPNVKKVLNWGRTGFFSLYQAFRSCANLTEVSCEDTIQWGDVAAASANITRAFDACSGLISVDIKGAETDVSELYGAREIFQNCTSLRTLTVKNFTFGKNFSQPLLEFCHNAGDPTLGCDFTVSNIKINDNINVDVRCDNAFKLARCTSITLSNFDFTNVASNATINMSSWFYQLLFPNASTPDEDKIVKIENFTLPSRSSNQRNVNMFYFCYASTAHEIQITGGSDRWISGNCYQMLYSSQVRKFKGLNKIKGAANVDSQGLKRMFRSAQYMTFLADPEYNINSDLFTDCGETSMVLFMYSVGRNVSTAPYNVPNIGDLDLSNITNMESAFYASRFTDWPAFNWDLSSCTKFNYAFYDAPTWTFQGADLDFTNCTFYSDTASTIDWQFAFYYCYVNKIKFPTGQNLIRNGSLKRTFGQTSNIDMSESNLENWDYSNIGTGSEALFLFQGSTLTLSPTQYAAIAAAIRATAPLTVSSNMSFANSKMYGGSLYASQQVGSGGWNTAGNTVITQTGVGIGTSVGDVFYQSNAAATTRYYYRVTAVNSNDEIEIASGLLYTGDRWNILTSQGMKDRQYLLENLATGYTDGSPILG